MSWCEVRQTSFAQLLYVIKDNRRLTHLNLAWNLLLVEQPDECKRNEDGTKPELELNAKNLEIMKCLSDFVKYNTNLIHLDVSHCGIIKPAIESIARMLRRA